MGYFYYVKDLPDHFEIIEEEVKGNRRTKRVVACLVVQGGEVQEKLLLTAKVEGVKLDGRDLPIDSCHPAKLNSTIELPTGQMMYLFGRRQK